jgi:AGCS family alanine or glycine:cation symporter
MGCKRGIYSNEAGQGTAPHIAAAANVSHPTKQGLVQSFSVYIDTLLVCSATGFMLLITGKYNVQNPVLGADGATQFYTKEQKMFLLVPDLHNLQWIAFFLVLVTVAIALFFFAFTTMLAYYYIAETNISYLTRNLKSPIYNHLLKVLMMVVIMYGINQAKLAGILVI